jgi:tRNA A37 threonylcarbamoyladenosine dehydratase
MYIAMGDYYTTMTHRVEMVLGPEVMERLGLARVIIFGVGGVGSWCAEGLVRSGIANLALVDSDVICPTNINRQLQATSLNIGQSKVRELRKRLLEINPAANIAAYHAAYNEESAPGFGLATCDYVIDAIDSLANKVHLLEECARAGITVFSSMGAAARTDPSKIKTAPLSKTHGCPLARSVRRRLRQKGVDGEIVCVYSDEMPAGASMESAREPADDCADGQLSGKKRVNGSLVHITAIFGFTLAGMVIDDIVSSAARSR